MKNIEIIVTSIIYICIIFSTKIVTCDLASDIDYASVLVDSFSSDCMFFSDYEEAYYTALTSEVDPLAKEIDENLVKLKVNVTELENLRNDYSVMLSDSRVAVDQQRSNLDSYVIFLKQVKFDLYNNLMRLRDEDMVGIEDHYVHVLNEFNNAESVLRAKNGKLFADTRDCIADLNDPEVEKIESALQSIGEILNWEYTAVMHASLLFSLSKTNTVRALEQVIQQLPPI